MKLKEFLKLPVVDDICKLKVGKKGIEVSDVLFKALNSIDDKNKELSILDMLSCYVTDPNGTLEVLLWDTSQYSGHIVNRLNDLKMKYPRKFKNKILDELKELLEEISLTQYGIYVGSSKEDLLSAIKLNGDKELGNDYDDTLYTSS